MTMPNGGGDDLFSLMYRRYYKRMRHYFRTVFRVSEEDAQELIHESFLKFWKMMDEYRGEAEWALLEKIALSVGCNRVRSLGTIKRGAVKPDSLDDSEHPSNHPLSEEADPLEQMIDAERKTRLRQEMAKLPKGQRQCLQLYLEDLTYDEISRALRMSLDAVRSRIRDAKRLLRERLGDEGTLPEDES